MWLSLIILTILFLEVYRRIYRCYCYNPFNPPRFLVRIDIAGKKNPNYLDLVDRFLVDNGFYEIERHHYEMFNWEAENSKQLEEKNLFYKKNLNLKKPVMRDAFIFFASTGVKLIIYVNFIMKI